MPRGPPRRPFPFRRGGEGGTGTHSPPRVPGNIGAGGAWAAAVFRPGGTTDPLRDRDVIEMYAPYSWMDPMVFENLGLAGRGEGWRLLEAGVTAFGGTLPVTPSGGLLGANPMGAAG